MELLTITTKRIPMDAMSYWPVLLVRPQYEDNTPLIEHERVHLREQALAFALAGTLMCVLGHVFTLSLWWALLLLVNPWWLLYAVPAFRLHAEVRGYRVQVSHGGISRARAAQYIAENYKLNITQAEAERLLTGD